MANYEELLKKRNDMIGFDVNDEKECLEAVREDAHALLYVKNQTEEICLEAVREDGYSLKYVPNNILKKIADKIEI